ncbi:His-Xaa-Ser system radical SAM maturase HxsC [Hymenobacter metallicola]|uniref:His-Xaa-Ser system radical SAM maturase HxsC n=1 Tax=Hymenobacter metallicola TaxID=2563114 RepID=A0A4Z0PZF0_9BACT|nr:His-Xaa-Ser system radical SAM maturase HxsC [Hymenobacter metallicola]TGE22694.1 His-Xaa-Ser system radical SAM maturase HxsC [Hymenobacter metallicola]
MLRTRGKALHITSPVVGKVTRDPSNASSQHFLITGEYATSPAHVSAFGAVLSTALEAPSRWAIPTVYGALSLDHLQEGDIVSLDASGSINTQYRVHSTQNFLLATERCNSNCLMCSQPPKDRDDVPYLMDIHRQLLPLIPKDCPELGVTGGEPTLLGENFFELLSLCDEHLPETELHCLTNGRTFALRSFAERLGELALPQLMLGIPLYADHYHLHDYIVQAPGAFDQTVRGLHNLANVNQRIEIRIVLHKLSVPRLVKLAHFIYKNLPFVEHVTFMGLENTGYTPHNIDKLWIDPVDYMEELLEAVEFLAAFRMHVSIYNHQLCILPPALWQFSRQSISDWKNIYLDACQGCTLKTACGGFFASCGSRHSRFIAPLLESPVS